jgi:hypothetical protein
MMSEAPHLLTEINIASEVGRDTARHVERMEEYLKGVGGKGKR